MRDSVVDTCVEDIKNEIEKEAKVNGTSRILQSSSFDSCVSEETSEYSGYSWDKVKSTLLEKIVLTEDAEAPAFFKNLYAHLKSQLSRMSTVVYALKRRRKSGYSEYTWWWDTVETSGEIELIDEDALNREIDKFSETFKAKNQE